MSTRKQIAVACLAMLLLGLAPIGAAVAQIKVTAANPASAYQGTIALDVVVSGSGFDPSAKVQYFVSGTTNPGGITVKNVRFNGSRELVTTIDVAETADLANFDIIVTLSSGRKGKGTTLFTVQPKPGKPEPEAPSYPAARAWHSFTSNGGSPTAMPRLYMYGGDGSDWMLVPADLWFYSVHSHVWTLITPQGTTKPGQRSFPGLSCAAGACVLATGRLLGGSTDETWIYSEAVNAWTLADCARRSPCPSPRHFVTIAFDPERGNHVLFGGFTGSTRTSLPTGFDDTWTFDAEALKWTARSPAFKPSERNRAAAVYVPGVGVVMHGGQDSRARGAMCDLFTWDGSNWASIGYDATKPYPCLHSHSAAWDGQALLVTGGYVDTNDTPSPANWRFNFAADGRSGTWTQVANGTCQPIDGTDAEIHPGARMAYDNQMATRVYFGGEQNVEGLGAVRYGNTVECY